MTETAVVSISMVYCEDEEIRALKKALEEKLSFNFSIDYLHATVRGGDGALLVGLVIFFRHPADEDLRQHVGTIVSRVAAMASRFTVVCRWPDADGENWALVVDNLEIIEIKQRATAEEIAV